MGEGPQTGDRRLGESGDDKSRPFTIEQSRGLWVARWGTPVAMIVCILGFGGTALLAGFTFSGPEARFAGLFVLLFALVQWYQVLYLLVYTDRALQHDVKILFPIPRTTMAFWESEPGGVAGRGTAVFRIVLGSAIALVVTLVALPFFGF